MLVVTVGGLRCAAGILWCAHSLLLAWGSVRVAGCHHGCRYRLLWCCKHLHIHQIEKEMAKHIKM